MPSIAYKSKLQAKSDHCKLSLNARHRLVVGSPSDTLYQMNKTRFPEGVDIRLLSNLVVTLSGTLDGAEISANDIIASSLAHHLADYFQMNAESLGLNTVSKLYIDDKNGLPTLTLTSSRQSPLKPYIHAQLVGIDLTYSWHISGSTCTSNSETLPQIASHPFSPCLSLPFRTLLDNVIGRFITFQLVKRYPLIFGTWCQQLDIEASYFPAIFSSVLTIMKRSHNPMFRFKCERLVKVIRSSYIRAASEASLSLSNYLGDTEKPDLIATDVTLTDEDVLYVAMERVYREGLRRPKFKGVIHTPAADQIDDEELSQDQTLLAQETRYNERLLWDDPLTIQQEVASRAWEDLFSDSYSSDMELNYDDETPQESGTWDNPHDLMPGTEDDHELYNPGSSVDHDWSIDIDFQDDECVTVPDVLNLSEEIASPSRSPFRPNHTELNRNEFVDPDSVYSLLDHVPSQADGCAQSSQGVADHVVREELMSHATILSTPPLSGLASNQGNKNLGRSQENSTLARKQPQSTSWPSIYKEYSYWPPNFPTSLPTLYYFMDIDHDLSMLTDVDSDDPHLMIAEENYSLEEFDEDADDLTLACPSLPGDISSHPTNPLVTCTQKEFQAEEHKNRHKELDPKPNINNTLDDGGNAVRNSEAIHAVYPIQMEDWGEDALLVIEF